jgi:hypothetical protein
LSAAAAAAAAVAAAAPPPTPAASINTTTGGPGMQPAVVIATYAGLRMYSRLMNLGTTLFLDSHHMQGPTGASIQDGQRDRPGHEQPTLKHSPPVDFSRECLPPDLGRTCLTVCSWAGGMPALWPLIKASIDLCLSPSCFTPDQPVLFPSMSLTPKQCAHQCDIVSAVQDCAFSTTALLLAPHRAKGPDAAADCPARSLAAHSGKGL